MAQYRYQIKGQNGQTLTGMLAADSLASAATVLRNQGAHILSLGPAGAFADRGDLMQRLRELNSGAPKQKHVLDLTHQLAVMMRAGINLRSALDGIAEQTTHPRFKRVIVGLKNDVEAGKQFSTALFDMAGQAREMARLLPAGLVLASLAGLGLAWRGHFPLALKPFAAEPRRFTAFTFDDQAVWLVVASLTILLVLGKVTPPSIELVAMNVLAVMLCLYAYRGAAVFRAGTGRPSALGVALYSVVAIVMFAFVASGLTVLGLADTWIDFRRRFAASSTGGGQ